MCFSMEMDLIAGTAITAIGVGAVRTVRDRRALPLAALPVAFGLHHLTEALIWADIEGHVPSAVGRPALWAYLLFAFGVLPWFTPVALRAIETDPRRRTAMATTAKFGAGVSAVLVASMLHGPVTATLDGHHLSYHVDLTLGGAVVAGYVLATCAPLLLSSHRLLVRYGLVNQEHLHRVHPRRRRLPVISRHLGGRSRASAVARREHAEYGIT